MRIKGGIGMVSIDKILNAIDCVRTIGKLPEKIYGITQDSRIVKPGYIFAARQGLKTSGLKFADQAKRAGAVAIMTNEPVSGEIDLPVIQVEDFRVTLIRLSKIIFDYPSRKLRLIGITSTDGKTTTVRLLHSIISAYGNPCGYMTTIGYSTAGGIYGPELTTPDIDRTCGLLAETVENARLSDSSKHAWMVMEVSSHGLALGRVSGLHFHAAGFINLTSEHRDFHPTMEHYALTKSRLFSKLDSDRPAVINIGGKWSKVMIENCSGKVITYGGSGSGADFEYRILDQSLKGGRFLIDFKDCQIEVNSPLIGNFQGDNITLAAGLAYACGIDCDSIVRGIEQLPVVPGRMELVDASQPFHVVVDFSHTAHALENALKSIRPLVKKRIITVFGAGGDRDKSKRPEMGKVVADLSDLAIVTSDNPRTEDPLAIISEIAGGVNLEHIRKTAIEPDRKAAIYKAVRMCKPDDVLLITGKGAEKIQIIGDEKFPFDDKQVALEALQDMGWRSTEGNEG